MTRRLVVLMFWAACVAQAGAQIPVPFVSNTERFMVFCEKHFEEVDARPPQQVFAMEGQLVYVSHDGELKVYDVEPGKKQVLETNAPSDVQATRNRIAWLNGDVLRTIRGGVSTSISNGVARYQVSDSLIVLEDTVERKLGVVWRNKLHYVADLYPDGERIKWSLGSNTLSWFDRKARKLGYFRRGEEGVLCDSADIGLSVAGGDVIGYWDDHAKQLLALANGAPIFLSDTRPVSMQAGNGMLAYVDGLGKLKCFVDGKVNTVMSDIPSGYWLKDEVLVYLDNGTFKLFTRHGAMTVENYVPEKWLVEGDALVYLDMNRELRGVIDGKRVRFGSEANIADFQLYGSMVVHRNQQGNTVVATAKRTFIF
ncbi:MAG TPA: hypothetical protein PK760_03865 [Flavobacteriales bacterium]|nr:hypothetical protein [Flavobacteriales bacterium]